jgi:3'-5' exoribonuclease
MSPVNQNTKLQQEFSRKVTNKKVFVRDLTAGTPVNDIFLIRSARQAQAKNGPYWSVLLQDSTGEVEAKIWSPLSMQYQELPSGTFVQIQAQAGTYRDAIQLTIEGLQFVEETDVSLNDFIPGSEMPPELLLEELEDIITEYMNHTPWKNFCRKVLRDETIRQKLLRATGAKAVHHAYVGGLLEHTLGVTKICISLTRLYPDLDRQVLIAAAIFHDLGKAWELSGDIANEYTDSGRLLGHIFIGLEKLEPFLRKSRLDESLQMHFKHLILSHHGEYEFGAPRRPKTPEAFVLHMADNMDAKLNSVYSAFENLEEGEAGWTPFQRYLDRYLFRPTPTPDKQREQKKKQEANQCLLPLKG